MRISYNFTAENFFSLPFCFNNTIRLNILSEKGGFFTNNSITITPIAYIKNAYNGKFAVPRQSGLAKSVESQIVFCPEYRDENCIRDIEQYSHLWLIWGFSENGGKWSPTVRPPRLGGNKRVGVFATRSPFRPNSLGLSCVKLKDIKNDENGKILIVGGADLADGTPIYDIKPYLPYVDCISEARGGFSEDYKNRKLEVEIPRQIADTVPPEYIVQIEELLSLDPRPSYQNDPERIYGFSYGETEIKFKCDGKKITVTEILK